MVTYLKLCSVCGQKKSGMNCGQKVCNDCVCKGCKSKEKEFWGEYNSLKSNKTSLNKKG